MSSLTYVLITPARNEAAFIDNTLESVVRQTVLPLQWVIVSDGSTDGTDEIVGRYAARYPWIRLMRMPERRQRHFAGKVHAFNEGYASVKQLKFDIVGSLDADISFDSGYFEYLLNKFVRNPSLGVAGTPFREGDAQYDYRYTSTDHVSGACQLFRRQCFEDIGGYRPLQAGGIDLVAVVTARMRGWETKTFLGNYCRHHRSMGSESHGPLMYAFKGGYHDFLMGVHPAWQLVRAVYQMRNKPYGIVGTVLLSGYIWAAVTGAEKPVSREFVRFRRKEQMKRLREFLLRVTPLPSKAAPSRSGEKLAG